MLSEYGNQNSFALAYNLYADQLLGTKVVPSFVYNVTQSYINSPNGTSSVKTIGCDDY